jgi:hypothetical protein
MNTSIKSMFLSRVLNHQESFKESKHDVDEGKLSNVGDAVRVGILSL